MKGKNGAKHPKEQFAHWSKSKNDLVQNVKSSELETGLKWAPAFNLSVDIHFISGGP